MRVLHKGDYKNKRYIYLGFGNHGYIPTALCDSKNGHGKMKTWVYVRNWKHVTCKKCLKIKKETNDE